MFVHQKIRELNDFFLELHNRPDSGVYFYRINSCTDAVLEFIQRYYETARLSGVVIEGKIPNPDEKNLAYYSEIMGMDFKMDLEFISSSLRKWLPRMNEYPRQNVAVSLYASLQSMLKAGKNENMLKNAYIKFMCWLYYKFERIVNTLGEEKVPKILYEGTISHYELMLISILSNAGCDVVLLQYQGDNAYLKLDEASALSEDLPLTDGRAFPPDFSLKWVRMQVQEAFNRERLYGTKPRIKNCTNAWAEGKSFTDICQSVLTRGEEPDFFYNCFYLIHGVEDKLTYTNELYQFGQELQNTKRKVVIVNGPLTVPAMEEISEIRRRNYNKQDDMLIDLSNNIQFVGNEELQRLAVKAFIDVMLEEGKQSDSNLHKLTNKGVYLLCWLKRYQAELFSNLKMPEVSCFISMGGCENDTETLFFKMLARLPVDVLVLHPNLNKACCLKDTLLYEIHYTDSLEIEAFPLNNSDVRIGTAAYHAERELDNIMYEDSGMYRNQQYQKANVVNLQTMYEEIKILWKQELQYRPNFSIVENTVNLPVIFAKVCGVPDGKISAYWRMIKALVTEETFIIKEVPYIASDAANPMKAYSTEFFKNARLQREKIKSHKAYPYGVLRDETQEYILDKLQLLIDQKSIKGTFENGTEYTIIATVLNMPGEILRLIQQFDFTKKNPKILYINTGETKISLEDSILMAFLNLIGFDIVFFVPTGYKTVETYFNRPVMEEHQIGYYIYDLTVPNLWGMSLNRGAKFLRDKLFSQK